MNETGHNVNSVWSIKNCERMEKERKKERKKERERENGERERVSFEPKSSLALKCVCSSFAAAFQSSIINGWR